MFLTFLFIVIFFTPAFCLLNCVGGPDCRITLGFNEIIPTNKQLLQTCSIIEARSCYVHLKIDYNKQFVNIVFSGELNETKPIYPFSDLLAKNREASIILRYTVKVSIHEDNEIKLYVLLQCKTIDQCAERQLRQFWTLFISLNKRRDNFIDFYKILYPAKSRVKSCFNDRTNMIEQCSTFDNICWASTNSQRRCTIYNEELYVNDFIYSYNKVYPPHRLTDENVHYALACHVNNCNDNKTINQLSQLARQFAEDSRSMNNSTTQQASFAIKLIGSYFEIFFFGLFIISKKFFCVV